jgi:signal transduction histidine kinase
MTMRIRVCPVTILFVCLAFNTAAAEKPAWNSPGEQVYFFSRQWLDIERAMLNETGRARNETLLEMAAVFRASLARVFESPLYQSYRFNTNYHGETVGTLFELSAAFEAAIREGREDALGPLAVDIRATLNTWQEQDVAIADAVHLSYFYQFFIFAAVIGLFALALWLLGRALRSSLSREKQRAAFSRDMVLTREAERGWIAAELHDSVIQELRHLSFMGYARHGEKIDREKLSAACDALITRVREICCSLIPPDFEKLGLLESLQDLCANFEKSNGVECRFVAPPDLRTAPLSKDMELQVFRIVQEALVNVEKHAGASEVSVALRNGKTRDGETLLVCVTDDGGGFKPSSFMRAGDGRGGDRALPDRSGGETLARHGAPGGMFRSAHLGVRGMYDRIAVLGGSLSFESAPGAGVMVRIELPLRS